MFGIVDLIVIKYFLILLVCCFIVIFCRVWRRLLIIKFFGKLWGRYLFMLLIKCSIVFIVLRVFRRIVLRLVSVINFFWIFLFLFISDVYWFMWRFKIFEKLIILLVFFRVCNGSVRFFKNWLIFFINLINLLILMGKRLMSFFLNLVICFVMIFVILLNCFRSLFLIFVKLWIRFFGKLFLNFVVVLNVVFLFIILNGIVRMWFWINV